MSETYKNLDGITPAIMSPMHDDGSFDESGMEKLLDHVLSAGVSGVFTLGVAGEYAVFNTETKKRIAKKVYSQVAGRVPVIVGVTGWSTQLVLENIEDYAQGNADFVLTTPPDFLEMTQDMCREFVLTVADKSPVPVIIYNCPLSRNYVGAATMAELAKHPNIAAVKETSSMEQVNDMREAMLERTDFTIMSGNEFIYFPALSMGFKSFIMGGPGNILPGLCVNIYNAYQHGQRDEPLDQCTKMVKFLQDLYYLPGGALIPGALAALKGVLSIMGLCGRQVSHPNLPVSDDQIKQIEQLMKKSGIFD